MLMFCTCSSLMGCLHQISFRAKWNVLNSVSGLSFVTVYMKYPKMKHIAGVTSLRSCLQKQNFRVIKCYVNRLPRNEIMRNKTSACANIKKTTYSNCCCGIRTAMKKKSLVLKKQNIFYQYFQLKVAKQSYTVLDEDS